MQTPLVETVLGPVSADRLGVIMPHEHFALTGAVADDLEPPAGYRRRVETWLREAVREAQSFGVGTLVEVTPIGCSRMVPMMQRVSRDTGIHVVASTGLYLGERRPAWVREKSVDELAEVFIRDLTDGIPGTDARAWMIKLAAFGGERFTDEDRKVFRAAALAANETGAAVTTHSCNAVRLHFDTLVEAGVEASRIYIGHADLVDDPAEHLHVARHGGHLLFTCWGIEHFVNQDTLAGYVTALVDAGFPQAVLLSIDYAIAFAESRMELISYEYECPYRTPGFLFRYALPKLREKGVTEDLVRQFTVDNPRTMLVRPGDAAAEPAEVPERIEVRSGVSIRTFSAETEADVIRVVNTYTAGWPYSRPIDASVVAHWRTMGDAFQPGHMLIACRDGVARAFLHGEKTDEQFDVHLLAAVPGAVEEATQLLVEVERLARAAGASRLVGPTWRAYRFYNGYILGHEPYHPHWERDASEAWVRAGWHIRDTALVMVAPLWRPIETGPAPEGYALVEAEPPGEFAARTFRYAATFEGKEVATCTGRLFPDLSAPGGGPVGQLGFVGTNEGHRGRGLARRLVSLSLRKLKHWGASECILATGLQNFPALRAYENAGFERRFNINEWVKNLAGPSGGK